MKQTLQLKVSQQLSLTPQLQQSIRLLQLSTNELNEEIERIAQENPMLELGDGNNNWDEWTFTPESGIDLTPSDSPITIDVTVDIPNTPYSTFTGDIVIVNQNNPADSETIPIALSTPKTKTIYSPIMKLLENYPILYHIIQFLLKH